MTNPCGAAQLALASRCGVYPNPKHTFFSTPPVIFDAYLAAVGSAAFPSIYNVNQALDAYGVVSATYGISVDEVCRWAETWRDVLTTAGTPR